MVSCTTYIHKYIIWLLFTTSFIVHRNGTQSCDSTSCDCKLGYLGTTCNQTFETLNIEANCGADAGNAMFDPKVVVRVFDNSGTVPAPLENIKIKYSCPNGIDAVEHSAATNAQGQLDLGYFKVGETVFFQAYDPVGAYASQLQSVTPFSSIMDNQIFFYLTKA